MSIYHEKRMYVTGFKQYEITDIGNVYIKGTNTTMIPLVLEGVKIFKNNYGKYLFIKQVGDAWFYFTSQTITGKKTNPERLSINLKTVYEATITLKWVEHKKYFERSKRGIEEAQKWARDLEKFYYPD